MEAKLESTWTQFDFKALKQKVSELAFIAWLEELGNPTPLQAAGGFL